MPTKIKSLRTASSGYVASHKRTEAAIRRGERAARAHLENVRQGELIERLERDRTELIEALGNCLVYVEDSTTLHADLLFKTVNALLERMKP